MLFHVLQVLYGFKFLAIRLFNKKKWKFLNSFSIYKQFWDK